MSVVCLVYRQIAGLPWSAGGWSLRWIFVLVFVENETLHKTKPMGTYIPTISTCCYVKLAERKTEREWKTSWTENERKSLLMCLSDMGVWFWWIYRTAVLRTKMQYVMLSRLVRALNRRQGQLLNSTLIMNEDASFWFRSICGELIHNRSIERGPYGHATNV